MTSVGEPAKTLTEALASLGYTHQRSANQRLHGPGAHDVQRDGLTVFSGRACDCWAWLRETHPELGRNARTRKG